LPCGVSSEKGKRQPEQRSLLGVCVIAVGRELCVRSPSNARTVAISGRRILMLSVVAVFRHGKAWLSGPDRQITRGE